MGQESGLSRSAAVGNSGDFPQVMANVEINNGSGHGGPVLPDKILKEVREISWTADADGTLLWIHPAAFNLYGISAEELVAVPGGDDEVLGPGGGKK